MYYRVQLSKFQTARSRFVMQEAELNVYSFEPDEDNLPKIKTFNLKNKRKRKLLKNHKNDR